MVVAGVVDEGTLAGWERDFEALDARDEQPRLFLTGYVALGRRPTEAVPVAADSALPGL